MASIKRMKAEYDFTAEEDGELTVKKGDVVFVNGEASPLLLPCARRGADGRRVRVCAHRGARLLLIACA